MKEKAPTRSELLFDRMDVRADYARSLAEKAKRRGGLTKMELREMQLLEIDQDRDRDVWAAALRSADTGRSIDSTWWTTPWAAAPALSAKPRSRPTRAWALRARTAFVTHKRSMVRCVKQGVGTGEAGSFRAVFDRSCKRGTLGGDQGAGADAPGRRGAPST